MSEYSPARYAQRGVLRHAGDEFSGYLSWGDASMGGDERLQSGQLPSASEVAQDRGVEHEDSHSSDSNSRRNPSRGTVSSAGRSLSDTVPHKSSTVRAAVNFPDR